MVRQKLLIVDDESDLLAELTPLLERAGFEVWKAADGGPRVAAAGRSVSVRFSAPRFGLVTAPKYCETGGGV